MRDDERAAVMHDAADVSLDELAHAASILEKLERRGATYDPADYPGGCGPRPPEPDVDPLDAQLDERSRTSKDAIARLELDFRTANLDSRRLTRELRSSALGQNSLSLERLGTSITRRCSAATNSQRTTRALARVVMHGSGLKSRAARLARAQRPARTHYRRFDQWQPQSCRARRSPAVSNRNRSRRRTSAIFPRSRLACE